MNSGFYVPERSNLGLQLTSPKSVAEICNPPMSAIDIGSLIRQFRSKARSYQSSAASHVDQRDISAFHRPLYKRPGFVWPQQPRQSV